MAMSKKDFIALADKLRDIRPETTDRYAPKKYIAGQLAQWETTIDAIVQLCHIQNPRFMEQRFRGYIHGECGSNGGAIKPDKPMGRVRRGVVIEGLDYIDEHGAIRTRKVGA